MPRNKKQRMVHRPPLFTSYKPTGIRTSELEQIPLSLDEYEAIKLADYMEMDHAEAALEMEISRSTFSRLIEKARKKAAEFLVEGKVLYLEGGNIHFRGNRIRCLDCSYIFNTEIEKAASECPECHSKNLLNLAGRFGHGRCCANAKHQKGGRHAT